ncbi:MAG TPA: hypothetical protein VFD58_36650 [Blastocatellia bacterium]|nr:hypothetical protein [Blastocatellia bacterium]
MKKTVPLLLVLALISACNGAADPVPPALEALEKLRAATEAKPTVETYNQLLAEAKDKVNTASTNLPDGELKRELNQALEAFVDAGAVWTETHGEDSFFTRLGAGKNLDSKYHFDKLSETEPGSMYAKRAEAMKKVWAIARDHTAKAVALSKNK